MPDEPAHRKPRFMHLTMNLIRESKLALSPFKRRRTVFLSASLLEVLTGGKMAGG